MRQQQKKQNGDGRNIEKNNMKSRGLGDSIEKITKSTGIIKVVKKIVGKKDCGCNKRKKQLNKLVPYKE